MIHFRCLYLVTFVTTHRSVVLARRGVFDGLAIVCCRFTPTIVSLLPQKPVSHATVWAPGVLPNNLKWMQVEPT